MRRKIRVLLVDDHHLLREAVAGVVASQPDMELVAEAWDGRQAIDLAIDFRPDVIIMDVSLVHLNGVDAARIIIKHLPATRVVMFTVHDFESILPVFGFATVFGYVEKRAASEQLLTAIREVHKGNPFLPSVPPKAKPRQYQKAGHRRTS